MLADESRELLRLRWSRWSRFERRRSRRGGDGEETELFRDRVKSWKLRRGEGERVLVSGSWRAGVVGSAGGVRISWVCVSVRMSVNSGGWGAVGWSFLGSGSLLSSLRLWRM